MKTFLNTPNITPTQPFTSPTFTSILGGSGSSLVSVYYGKKRYELSDWLGNVRVVVSDKKVPESTSGTTVLNYKPEILSIRDYYAFGSDIFEHTHSTANLKYRYSFNGKEDIDKSFQDYGARYYNKLLSRFISADPLIVKQQKYAELSSYQFAGNIPTKYIDLDGLEGKPRDITKNSPKPKRVEEYELKHGKINMYGIEIEYTTINTGTISNVTGRKLKVKLPTMKEDNKTSNEETINRASQTIVELNRYEDRIDNRVILYFEEEVRSGKLIIDYNLNDNNNNQNNIEVGIIDEKGTEKPLVNVNISDNTGKVEVDFSLNENENLYYRSEGNVNINITALKNQDNERINNKDDKK